MLLCFLREGQYWGELPCPLCYRSSCRKHLPQVLLLYLYPNTGQYNYRAAVMVAVSCTVCTIKLPVWATVLHPLILFWVYTGLWVWPIVHPTNDSLGTTWREAQERVRKFFISSFYVILLFWLWVALCRTLLSSSQLCNGRTVRHIWAHPLIWWQLCKSMLKKGQNAAL